MGLLCDCKTLCNPWEPSFEALHSRPGWGHGARRRHTTSVILPSTVSWLAEHGALSHCLVSLHHRDMGARYLHRISTVSTQDIYSIYPGTGWPDASPRDHQLAEVRVDGSMSSAGWSGVEQQVSIRDQSLSRYRVDNYLIIYKWYKQCNFVVYCVAA